MVCPGKVWCGWLGGLWHGRLLYGLFRLGWQGMVGLVLLAFGFVRLEWFVGLRRGHVRQGLAWQARLGEER